MSNLAMASKQSWRRRMSLSALIYCTKEEREPQAVKQQDCQGSHDDLSQRVNCILRNPVSRVRVVYENRRRASDLGVLVEGSELHLVVGPYLLAYGSDHHFPGSISLNSRRGFYTYVALWSAAIWTWPLTTTSKMKDVKGRMLPFMMEFKMGRLFLLDLLIVSTLEDETG
jgi:hypothetical protein